MIWIEFFLLFNFVIIATIVILTSFFFVATLVKYFGVIPKTMHPELEKKYQDFLLEKSLILLKRKRMHYILIPSNQKKYALWKSGEDNWHIPSNYLIVYLVPQRGIFGYSYKLTYYSKGDYKLDKISIPILLPLFFYLARFKNK